MAKGQEGKTKSSADQLGLFDRPKKGRKTLGRGESRRYRSRKGHTYQLTRIE